MEAIEFARRTALASLKPPPRLNLSQWMESAMRLPEGVSATPGPVRLWPYQRAIADAISDPTIERVTLVKPVRVGFSTLLTGAVASFVANEPSPILVLLPTEADCVFRLCRELIRIRRAELGTLALKPLRLTYADTRPLVLGSTLADAAFLLENEDVLQQQGVAFHALHFGDVGDFARSIRQTRLLHN